MTALANLAGARACDLRQEIYGEGDPTRADLERLIASSRARDAADADFAELIADVATDVLVRQADPVGSISQGDADWLVNRLAEAVGLISAVELNMLEALLAHAVSAPASLSAFAVRAVEKAILTGKRDALSAVDQEPGVVTSEDVEALRALAFAPARGHRLRVDKATAQALFDIAHATATADNAPEFADFFAHAVGNYLIGADVVAAPADNKTVYAETELARPAGFGAFLAQMLAGKPNLAAATPSRLDESEDLDGEADDENDRRLAESAQIDGDEAKWVIAHLTRGGELTPAEKRLLGLLRDETAFAPPELSELYAQAA